MSSVKKILLNEKFEIEDLSGKIKPLLEDYFFYFKNFEGKSEFYFKIEFDNQFSIFYKERKIFSHKNPFLILNFLDFFIKENIFPDFKNFLILHASCISDGKNSFLISGRTGSGKSTLAFLLSKEKFFYMGDDIIPILKKKKFFAGSYPQPAGIYRDLKGFLNDEKFIEDENFKKIFVFPKKIMENSFLPLKIIIFPVPSRLNKVERMKKSMAFFYLSAVCLNSSSYMRIKGLDLIKEIVNNFQVYKIFWNSFDFLKEKFYELIE